MGNLLQGVRKGLLEEVMFEQGSQLGRSRRTHLVDRMEVEGEALQPKGSMLRV